MGSICDFLNSISSNEIFQKLFGEPPYSWRFIPNEIEGRAELASYLEDNIGEITNLTRINLFYTNLGKPAFNSFKDFIYGSLGSSSSQIFVPRKIETLSDNCKIVNLTINDNPWSIILIPDNTVDGKYIPFEILQQIYSQVKLEIAISNSISHAFYSKDGCFKTLTNCIKDKSFPVNYYVSTTLFELKELIERIINIDKLEKSKQNICGTGGRGANIYEALKKISDEDFLTKVTVIPRFSTISIKGYESEPYNFTYDKTTIQNGWTNVIQITDGKQFADIGGGKTNSDLESYLKREPVSESISESVNGILTSVLAEVTNMKKDMIDINTLDINKLQPKSIKAAGLTGKIRADLESFYMVDANTCQSIQKLDDIKTMNNKYNKYFETPNIPSYALVPIIPIDETTIESSGGKRTRKRHKKKSKRRRSKKTNKMVRRKRKYSKR
jgi:hypothetical protein